MGIEKMLHCLKLQGRYGSGGTLLAIEMLEQDCGRLEKGNLPFESDEMRMRVEALRHVRVTLQSCWYQFLSVGTMYDLYPKRSFFRSSLLDPSQSVFLFYPFLMTQHSLMQDL